MKKTEICTHCGVDYIPKRRGVQKFCSNSCRSRYWQLKQPKIKVTKVTETQKNELPEIKDEPKKDSMSFAGVGNAAVGSILADGLKSAFISDQNKPAKKKDIDELKSLIIGQRYLPVKNVDKNMFNQSAYYDIETGNVIFMF